MKPGHKLLVFVTYLGMGVTMPMLSLLFCAHGCTLDTLGLAFSVNSLAVIVFELPSGIFADLYGRKRSFLMSRAMGAASAAVLLLARVPAAVFAGAALMGLSSAFASGSLDAAVIENSSAPLSKTLSAFSAYQCAGIACGALLGGLLPSAGGYAAALAAKFVLCLAAALGSLALPKEPRRPPGERPDLRTHLGRMVSLLGSSSALRCAALCIVAVAVSQTALETYWQPRLVSLTGGDRSGLLGLLSAASYVATTAGCALMGRVRLDGARRRWRIYLGLAASFAALIFALSFTGAPALFFAVYTACFLVLGMENVPEQTVINLEADNGVRASVLSVISLAVHLGSAASGPVGSALLPSAGIPGLWRIFSLFSLAALLPIALSRRAASARA